MSYSHVLITRPGREAAQLARMLESLPAEIILLPSHTFQPLKLPAEQLGKLRAAAPGSAPNLAAPLLIFTSPRAVEFGLSQLPLEAVRAARVAAIGPATSALLEQAGIAVSIRSRQGYDSEHLLAELFLSPAAHAAMPAEAFIVAAPGGRSKIRDSLQAIGYSVHMLLVYGSQPAGLDPEAVRAIEQGRSILTVFTSANAMTSLSLRLPGPCWHRLCQGDWLVISERLEQMARSYNIARVHITRGPANEEIAAAVRALFKQPHNWTNK